MTKEKTPELKASQLGAFTKRDIASFGDAASIVYGSKVKTVIENVNPLEPAGLVAVDPDNAKHIELHLQPGQAGEIALHELMHIKDTQFTGELPKLLTEGGANVRTIWNIIEDGRVDRLGTEWFDKPIWNVHREAIITNLPKFHDAIKAMANSEDEAARRDAVRIAAELGLYNKAYNLGLASTGMPKVDKALEYFNDDIDTALTTDDRLESMRLAMRVGTYLDLYEKKLTESPPPPTPAAGEEGEEGDSKSDQGPEKSEGENNTKGGEDDGDGEGSDQVKEPDKGEDDSAAGAKGEGKSDDSQDDSKDDSPMGHGYGAKPKPNNESSFGDPLGGSASGDSLVEIPDMEKFEAEAEADLETIKKDAERMAESELAYQKRLGEANRFEKERLKGANNPEVVGHEVNSIPGEVVPLVRMTPVENFVHSMPDQKAPARRSRMGSPTSEVWKLNTGKMDLFERSPKTSGKVVVLVDRSGSMSAYIEDEESLKEAEAGVGYGYSYNSRGEVRRLSSKDKDMEDSTKYLSRNPIKAIHAGGTLAWQVVSAITGRYPDAEVYTFDSDYPKAGDTNIFRVENGMRPAEVARGNNLDCAALMWLRERLAGDMDGSIAIIVTDGHPAAHNQACQPYTHTKRVAEEMADMGLRFISVGVGFGVNTIDYIYPADVVVKVPFLRDIENLGPAMSYITDRMGW